MDYSADPAANNFVNRDRAASNAFKHRTSKGRTSKDRASKDRASKGRTSKGRAARSLINISTKGPTVDSSMVRKAGYKVDPKVVRETHRDSERCPKFASKSFTTFKIIAASGATTPVKGNNLVGLADKASRAVGAVRAPSRGPLRVFGPARAMSRVTLKVASFGSRLTKMVLKAAAGMTIVRPGRVVRIGPR